MKGVRRFQSQKAGMTGARLLFFTIVILTVFSVSKARAASFPTKIIISHSGMNARQAPLWVTQEQGFFTKYGINTDLVFIRAAPMQVAAIASGYIQIGSTAASSVLGAAAAGADLKIIGAFTNQLTLIWLPDHRSRELRTCVGNALASRALGELCGWALCLG